jgi:hypothetical protein
MPKHLESTYFIDSNSVEVTGFVEKHLQPHGLSLSPQEKAKILFLAVRDEIRYDPYRIDLNRESMKASTVLKQGYGYCVTKAVLLTAVWRAAGIPSLLGFANVMNHLNSARLRKVMRSDIFVFHGYSGILLGERWFKATPAFNIQLCHRANILPIDFDGTQDAIFHPFDAKGNKHMEYIIDHGWFEDLPYQRILDEYETHYPHLKTKETLKFSSFFDNKAKFEDEVERSKHE